MNLTRRNFILAASALPVSALAATPMDFAPFMMKFGGVDEWDTIITKSSDQIVTNASMQDDTQLLTPLAANGLYEVELLLLYSGNNTAGDYSCRFTVPTVSAGTSVGWICHFLAAATLNFVAFDNASGQIPPAVFQGAGTAGNTPLTTILRTLFKNEGNAGNLQFQFGNNSVAVGRTSTTYAGTTLKLKRYI